ncbi:MAG: creatininase [Hyphomonadaceae bacterium]|nr:MAG: creatininase [Hyphomonadaceae bacterium]KAF0184875.1 MAG: creatininase [Hyphomonadaceae bacterium]
MHLSTATWQEIEARVKSGKTSIIIPIGSHEQHGPTGLIGTDALCPEIIAKACEAQNDVLIAPTFSVGMAQHHIGFPGSITLRPTTMIAAMVDWTNCLAKAGLTRLYWLNGHGGNVATINAAFSESYVPYSMESKLCPFAHKISNWWDLPEINKFCYDMYPIGHGSHGTASEVAVTYWGYPERAVLGQMVLDPKIAPDGPIRDAVDYRKRFPDGRIGSDPTQATIEQGGQIVAKCITALMQDLAIFEQS